MITGPMIAVNPVTNVRTVLIGCGNFPTNLIIPSVTFIKNVCIFKNSSPMPARSALSPSSALLYLPEADSVTILNSRPATPASSAELAFIKSIT